MQQVQESLRSRFYWIGGILLAGSLLARVISYPVVTSDYTYFLSKWFGILQSHPGFTAFAAPFSDYAPLYLYFLKFLTFLPVPSLYSIKTFSFLFDIAIAAIAAYLLIKRTAPIAYEKAQLFFAFALVLSIPTLVLDSSLWGQSDAVYAAGVVASLYFVLVDKPLPAVFSFACAFCVKLQAVFFLPILAGYALRKEKSAGYLILIPVLYFLSILPARLGGGALSGLLLVYAKESGEYTSLSVSAQNVFALSNGYYQFPGFSQNGFFLAGITVAALCAFGIAALVYYKEKLSARGLVFLSLLCVLVLPYVLPRMHERYFYLADILSVIYAFYHPRSWYVSVLVVGASVLSYMPYLSQVDWFSGVHIDLRIPSLMVLAVLAVLSLQFRGAVAESTESASTALSNASRAAAKRGVSEPIVYA